MNNFNGHEQFSNELILIDYGFLWGHIYDKGGFGDLAYWVFQK